MIPYDTLCAAWRTERPRRLARHAPSPRLDEDGLMLGPIVALAKRTTDRWGAPRLSIDGNEARILALLSVAYWRPFGAEVIGPPHRA